jgi:hypothetical protein
MGSFPTTLLWWPTIIMQSNEPASDNLNLSSCLFKIFIAKNSRILIPVMEMKKGNSYKQDTSKRQAFFH